jgi:hypothetical protein
MAMTTTKKKKPRHWRPYTKLTITEAWHIKQIGRARGYTEARVLFAYKRAGRLTKLKKVMSDRMKKWRKWPHPNTKPRIDSSETVAKVFGVGPRLVAGIWNETYWKDA